MPYSKKAKFRHDERRSARGFVRVRTVRLRGGKELRIGYRRDGSSAVVSVLRPKNRASPFDRYKRRWSEDPSNPMVWHAESHSDPSHHVGSCDERCRHGLHTHPHRPAFNRR